MQEQRDSVKQPDVLSWQYVVLMVAIALLVVLIAAVPVDIQRAAAPTEASQVAAAQPTAQQPTAVPTQAGTAEPTAVPSPVPVAPLTATSLDQHYEDDTGLAFDYPEGWYTGMPQVGYVLLTNFPQDVQNLPDNWAIIGFQTGTLADLASPDGTVPEPGTSASELVQSLLDTNGLSDLEIQELTLDGQPAARVHIVNQGREFEFVLAVIQETEIVSIRAEVTDGTWETASPLFDEILASLTFTVPAS